MDNVRAPAVAGLFYPSDPVALALQIDAYLVNDQTEIEAQHVKAIIAPHAGYVYSGPIAGHVFALLHQRRATVRRVILLGPAHRVYFKGSAAPGVKAMSTPLGNVSVESLGGVPDNAHAHAQEHSLEVELPFLQRALGRDVVVVPLLVGDATAEDVAAVLRTNWGGEETVIVVSSDLSHYRPYAEARAVDAATAARVLALDATIDHEQACGATPLNGLLLVAKERGLEPTLVDLRNSGDTAGDKGRVVGYAGFAFSVS